MIEAGHFVLAPYQWLPGYQQKYNITSDIVVKGVVIITQEVAWNDVVSSTASYAKFIFKESFLHFFFTYFMSALVSLPTN